MRGHAGVVDRVLVLDTLGAPPRARLGRRRRAQAAAPGTGPEPVTTGRATLVRPEPLADPLTWLRDADGEALAAEAVEALNRVLHLHRVASADPWAREVSREQALVIRVGFGEGEQVAGGRWERAVTLPPPPAPRRTAALRPTERLAELLGARDAALACEELVLRGRADLAAGRLREAALQADVALRAAVAELAPWASRGGLRERLEELRGLQPGVAAAASQALEGGLDDEAAAAVAHGVERLEAALRARTAGGL